MADTLGGRYLAAGLMFGIDGEFHTSARVGLELKTGFKWGIDRGMPLCIWDVAWLITCIKLLSPSQVLNNQHHMLETDVSAPQR